MPVPRGLNCGAVSTRPLRANGADDAPLWTVRAAGGDSPRGRTPDTSSTRKLSPVKRPSRFILVGLLVAIAAAVASAVAWHRHRVAVIARAAVPPVPDLPGWPALYVARVHVASAAAVRLRDPERALRELAGLYHANRLYDQARQVELGLAALEPSEARWRYYLSDAYRNLGDMEATRRYLEQAVARAPQDRALHLRLGELLFKEGDTTAAMREYRARLALLPGDPYARLGLARTALATGDRAAARHWLEEIVRDTPEFAPSHNLLAQMYGEDGLTAQAEEERRLGALAGRFREADDPWLFRLNAWTFDPSRLALGGAMELRRQELERAARLCREVISSAPTTLDAYQALGAIHISLGYSPDPTKPVVDLGGDLKERMARGKRVFDAVCFTCHMPHGEGQPGIFPPLARSDFLSADRSRAITVPLRGLNGTIVVNGTTYTNTMLPQSQLTTAQIADVLTYVMNSWGNNLGEVTGAEVERAAQR